MKQILLIVSILNFMSYLWSVLGVFKKVPQMEMLRYRMLQVNNVALWIFLPLAIYHSNLKDEVYILCIFIQIFTLASFWSHTKFVKEFEFSIVYSADTPKRLLQKGFYVKIRHPFYMIYTLTYFSLAFATMDLASLFLSFTMLGIYFNAAKYEEQKFLDSPLRDSYQQYMATTGMFLPKFFRKTT